jgi:hypothetical protein
VLADHGGPTLTHELLPGSPALEAGDPAGCNDAAGEPLAFDQRGAGFPRVRKVLCDKGAVEGIDGVFRDGFE